MKQSRVVVVGAFLIGGFLLFAGGLFLIGDRRLLFTPEFVIYTELGKVTGLQVGSRVRLAGLDAGEVLEIAIPPRPSEKFRVRMRLREDVHQLVRADSIAAVQTDGIVGNTFIQVGRGTDASPIVAPGATIAGSDPVEFADLIQEGRATFQTVSREVVSLRSDVEATIAALTDTIQTADGLLSDVGSNVGTITKSSRDALEDFRRILTTTRAVVDDVKAGRGTVGQLLTDDGLYQRLREAGTEVERTMRNLRETTDRGRSMMERFTASDGAAQQIVAGLRDTVALTQEVASDLAEGTEALKRSFLFRGFFRQRGFYDLDAISREAYQAGALEGKDRTALRVWIEADALFARGADGREQLTEAGRRRLDSVMADFVRYPRDSPLVVEGYAESAAGDAPYLLSADRASLVRDYLVGRFRRKPTLVDYIALSDEAEGSPRGDGRWSGVALTLFVRNDALARAANGASRP